jgi:CheY-like chemotaxis protein
VSGRILVADDDPASAEMLTCFLESKGFSVGVASDGNLAVEMGSTGDFEVAILDVHLPVYDGVEVLDLLRRRHVLHPIKVIALTGDLSEHVHDALEGGQIDAYMTKPVDLPLLAAEVERLVGA